MCGGREFQAEGREGAEAGRTLACMRRQRLGSPEPVSEGERVVGVIGWETNGGEGSTDHIGPLGCCFVCNEK